MICSSENLEPFIAASSSGGTLLKTGGVLGAQVSATKRSVSTTSDVVIITHTACATERCQHGEIRKNAAHIDAAILLLQ
jgi:hypothetical protein